MYTVRAKPCDAETKIPNETQTVSLSFLRRRSQTRWPIGLRLGPGYVVIIAAVRARITEIPTAGHGCFLNFTVAGDANFGKRFSRCSLLVCRSGSSKPKS